MVMHHTTAGQLGAADTGWRNEDVLWSCVEAPLLVTYNQVSPARQTQRHAENP